MKTISDNRLPNTTTLPDHVSLEAVVTRKTVLTTLQQTAGREHLTDQQLEELAISQEDANAHVNARIGQPYQDVPGGRSYSSTLGCPPPEPVPEPEPTPEITEEPQ